MRVHYQINVIGHPRETRRRCRTKMKGRSSKTKMTMKITIKMHQMIVTTRIHIILTWRHRRQMDPQMMRGSQ